MKLMMLVACLLTSVVWSNLPVLETGMGDFELEELLEGMKPMERVLQVAPGGIRPGVQYTFAGLREALRSSPTPVKDAEEALSFIPREVKNKLDQWGVKIIYQESFFRPDPNCRIAGTYTPFLQMIQVHCPASISVLLAEGAHAVDHFLGRGSFGFRTQEDPQFQSIHRAYKTRVDAHARSHGHSGYKEHMEKVHSTRWNFFPGPLDADLILGKQGYESDVELYMEGFIYHYYNHNKLQSQALDLADYITRSIEQARRAPIRRFNAELWSPEDIIKDPVW